MVICYTTWKTNKEVYHIFSCYIALSPMHITYKILKFYCWWILIIHAHLNIVYVYLLGYLSIVRLCFKYMLVNIFSDIANILLIKKYIILCFLQQRESFIHLNELSCCFYFIFLFLKILIIYFLILIILIL